MSDHGAAAPVVLIVDDSATNRALVQASLRNEGYRLLHAVDGLSGLAVARLEKPDLIIIDLMMPDMSGTELIERLRREGGQPLPSLLLYTALDEHEGRSLAAKIGVDGCLTKPCPPALMRVRVRETLALHAQASTGRP